MLSSYTGTPHCRSPKQTDRRNASLLVSANLNPGLIAAVLVFLCVTDFAWSKNNRQISPSGENETESGVVVEAVVAHNEGAKAGLQAGDILLAWSRADSRGEIRSPFDLAAIEIEQAPLGTVILEGRSGGATKSWSIGPTAWQIAARPRFSGDQLTAYRTAKDLADSGNPAKIKEAMENWKALANQYSGSQDSWIPAWLLFHAAESLRNAKQWKEADEAYQSSIQYAASAGPPIEAQLLQAWAAAYQQRSDWVNAEKYLQQAIIKTQGPDGSTLLTASCFDALADIREQRGDLDKSDEFSRRALEIKNKLAPATYPVAKTLHILGTVAYDRGDLTQAEQYYQQAYQIRSTVAPDSLAVASSYTSFGIIAWQRGDLSKWDEYEHKALAIRKKLAPESFLEAASLNNLGMIAEARGDFTKAEQYYYEAFELKQKLVPGSLSLAGSLVNLGNVSGDRGDLDQAEQYYRQALDIQQKLAPETLNIAAILGNLGKLEQRRGNLDKAEQYYRQTLDLQQKISPRALRVSVSFNDLGEVAEKRGDLGTAAQYYHQSLEIKEKLGSESLNTAQTLYGLGNVSRRSGDLASAEKYYRQSAALREKLAPGSAGHAESLAAVASVLRDQQQLDSAEQFYARAVSALENQSARLGGSEEVRSGFGARHSEIYGEYVDLLLARNQPERAFAMLERSRARILLEMLSAAHVDIREGGDPLLLAQERSLQESLAGKRERRLRQLATKNSEKQVAATAQEIEELERQYQDVEGRLRVNSPAYAALTQPQPLSAEEIQKQTLDSETLLLEYSLGEERSHVFVVSPNSLEAVELPKRSIIEDAARRLSRAALALEPPQASADPRTQRARMERANSEYRRAASKLSEMILAPVRELRPGKRLLIVADGALQYIPVAALPSPKKTKALAGTPLMIEHEIVNLPSASVLAEIRRAARTSPARLQREVAVLADPVFDAADERVGGGPQPHPEHAAPLPSSVERLSRSAKDIGFQTERGGGNYLGRLLYTRDEARAIAKVAPHGQFLEALDFQASRATAMSPELASYRIVHFATHGLVDSKHPELSGLVLSLVDRKGRPQDGFLGLEDIYNLHLPADLVVLSGCETGLGEEINGEGLIGLTRGFMYAGAGRVVASLWNVDDLATSELMTSFYRAMEVGKMRPAAALRHAQIAMWKQREWHSPYYWAGFQIQGDWR